MQKILVQFLYKYRGEVKTDWAHINTEKRKVYTVKELLPILKRNLKKGDFSQFWEIVTITAMYRPCQ